MLSNASSSKLSIVTRICAELSLGESDVATESAKSPVAVPRIAWWSKSFQFLLLPLLGALPAKLPIRFLKFLSLLHDFSVLSQVTDFLTAEACPLFPLSSGCFTSLPWPSSPFSLGRGRPCDHSPASTGCASGHSPSTLFPFFCRGSCISSLFIAQVIHNSFLHFAKTDFAFDKKQPFIIVSMCYFIILHTEYNNALWI